MLTRTPSPATVPPTTGAAFPTAPAMTGYFGPPLVCTREGGREREMTEIEGDSKRCRKEERTRVMEGGKEGEREGRREFERDKLREWQREGGKEGA